MASCLRANVRRSLRFCQKSAFGREQCPMLDEGVDIPSVDGVLFFDPSIVLRTLSRQPGELKALWGKTIRLSDRPHFCKGRARVSDLLESSDFKQVGLLSRRCDSGWKTGWRHQSFPHPERWRKAGAENLAGEKKSLEEKLNESLLFANIPRKMSSESFIKQVDVRVIEELGTSWDYNYGLLKAYRKQFPDRWPEQERNILRVRSSEAGVLSSGN